MANSKRAKVHQAAREELANSKKPLTYSRSRETVELTNLPAWKKAILALSVFAFCGGLTILELIADLSQDDPRHVLWLVPIALIGVAGYGYWNNELAKSSDMSTGDHHHGVRPMEKVHGKWRPKREGSEEKIPDTSKTRGQLKERKPSRKYAQAEQQQHLQAQVSSREFDRAVLVSQMDPMSDKSSLVPRSQIMVDARSL